MRYAVVRVLPHPYQLVDVMIECCPLGLNLALDALLPTSRCFVRNLSSLILVNPHQIEAKHDCGDGDRANDCRRGKMSCGGDCDGKIPYLSQFTSVHR